MNINTKKKNISMFAWFAFALAIIAVFATIAISGAWFTDTAEGGGVSTMTFGTVSISATPQNKTTPYSSNLLFTPTELLPESSNKTITRTLQIANTGTVPIYTRFKPTISFTDGTAINDMITITGVSTNSVDWQLKNGYYIYCANSTTANSVAASANVVATLSFVLNSNFGNTYANKTLRVTFDVDAVQAANNSATLTQTQWVN